VDLGPKVNSVRTAKAVKNLIWNRYKILAIPSNTVYQLSSIFRPVAALPWEFPSCQLPALRVMLLHLVKIWAKSVPTIPSNALRIYEYINAGKLTQFSMGDYMVTHTEAHYSVSCERILLKFLPDVATSLAMLATLNLLRFNKNLYPPNLKALEENGLSWIFLRFY